MTKRILRGLLFAVCFAGFIPAVVAVMVALAAAWGGNVVALALILTALGVFGFVTGFREREP